MNMYGKQGHILSLKDLSIGYQTGKGQTVVASGIQAQLRGGELTCLLGANGVGKSTLLRTLAAFQPRLDGCIAVDGVDILTMDSRQRARTIGVVLTEKPDVRHLSVRDMVALGRSPYTGFWGTCSEQDWQTVDEAIRLVGIGELAGRTVNTLSDGEKQKVMIAKALAQQTPVILLDEPTAFLDFPSKVEVMVLLRRLCCETGKIIFLSTHDVDIALQLSDTVWLMARGQALATGTPEDLALEGRLGAFSEGETLLFDSLTGRYAINMPVTAAMTLEGHDPVRMAMVRKALLRYGIQAGDVSSTGVAIPVLGSILVRDDAFVITAGNKNATALTVAEIVDFLR